MIAGHLYVRSGDSPLLYSATVGLEHLIERCMNCTEESTNEANSTCASSTCSYPGNIRSVHRPERHGPGQHTTWQRTRSRRLGCASTGVPRYSAAGIP